MQLSVFIRRLICLMLLPAMVVASSDYIVVKKKNVLHKFVSFSPFTDRFIKQQFANWENETFDVFDQVKDPSAIAIDLGAWIGTTAIWLSKNFYHVVAVDADKISLNCLKMNLKASECPNVSICERPIAEQNQTVIFGPNAVFGKNAVLNLSSSCIKKEQENIQDYTVEAITFKQLVDEYVYADEHIKPKNVAFIKCDIEGGEEYILRDVLEFAYSNKAKVYLSFHLSWWKSKKITDFKNLFTFFKTNCPGSDVCEYIRRHPFTSVLFEPLDKGTLTV